MAGLRPPSRPRPGGSLGGGMGSQMGSVGGRDPLSQDDPFGTPRDSGDPQGAPYTGIDQHDSQGSQGPRERPTPSPIDHGSPGGGPTATPGMPPYPAPQAGSGSIATSGGSTDSVPGGGPGGNTFSPLPSPAMGMLTSSRRSLYGKAGGLLGGGLGAQDTTSNNVSDPISSLIQILQKRNGGI